MDFLSVIFILVDRMVILSSSFNGIFPVFSLERVSNIQLCSIYTKYFLCSITAKTSKPSPNSLEYNHKLVVATSSCIETTLCSNVKNGPWIAFLAL